MMMHGCVCVWGGVGRMEFLLELGIVNNLQEHARVPCGFAGIKDVRTGSHEDR